MKHPPYHLRVNKAAERLVFINAVKRLENLGVNLSEYTYYGLGGPYLEDFRLMYELCPEIKMVSIEINDQTFERQKFHIPCGTLCLVNDRFESFLSAYSANGERSIFWLDYSDLKYARFSEFMELLGKLTELSMLKITLRADPRDYFDSRYGNSKPSADEFRKSFEEVMPDPSAKPPKSPGLFAKLVQDMLRIATQYAIPSGVGLLFQPLSSFRYSDGIPMYTLTGVVCRKEQIPDVINAFNAWEFANLNWANPRLIDLPDLSTKERLLLQEYLPCRVRSGRVLRRALGYNIDSDLRKTERKLKQYAAFHRYSPYYVKAKP